MSPTDEEIAQLLSRVGSRSASQRETIVGIESLLARARAAESRLASFATAALHAERNVSHSDLDAKYDAAAWQKLAEKLESDLSAAREEIVGLEAALNRIVYLRPAGPTLNKLVEQMERIALEALCSRRTKVDSPRIAVPSADIGADAATAADLPEHLQWNGDGPAPASWFAADGTKVYRSYGDYCDD